MSDIVRLKSRAQRYYSRGSNASYAGKLPEAVYYLRKAVSGERDNPEYIIDLLSVLNQVGYYEETLTYGGEALQMQLTNAQKGIVYFHMGEACYCLGLNVPAISYINSCLDIDPEGTFSRDALLYKTELRNDEEPPNSQEHLLSSEEEIIANNIARFQSTGDLALALRECDTYCVQTGYSTKSLEILAALHLSGSDFDSAYQVAERILDKDPENVPAMLFGYTASVHLENAYGVRRFSACLKRLRDCSDYDLQMLCQFFDKGLNDNLAKDIFASIYNENTFWKEAGFALAIGFYNTGESQAATKALKRLEQLEGGGGVASLCLQNLSLARPPQRLSYHYVPTQEQMDMLSTELYLLLDHPAQEEDYYLRLEEVLTTAFRFISPVAVNEFLYGLPMDNEKIATILRRIILDFNLEAEKKLFLAQMLQEVYPKKEINLNFYGNVVSLKTLKELFFIRNFDVPRRLEEKYGIEAIDTVYRSMPLYEDILPLDSSDQEFALLAEILLCNAAGAVYCYEDLCEFYGIDAQRRDELKKTLQEKGILQNADTD